MKLQTAWKLRGAAGMALTGALLLLTFTAALAGDVLPGVRTEVVSKSATGEKANGMNDGTRINSTRFSNVSQHPYPNESAGSPLLDGRIVAYTSKVSNLYPLGGDPDWNVYVNDLEGQLNMGGAYLVSQTSGGGQGNGSSAFGRVDPSGQFVVFQSNAENFNQFGGMVDGRAIVFDSSNPLQKADIFIVSLGVENEKTPSIPVGLSVGNVDYNDQQVIYTYGDADSGFIDGTNYDQYAVSSKFEWPFAIYRTYSGNRAGIGPGVIFQSRATNFESGSAASLSGTYQQLYAIQLFYTSASNNLAIAQAGFPPSQPALLTKGYDCGAAPHYSCEANGDSSGPAVSSGGRRFVDGGVLKGDFNLTENGWPVAGRYVVFTSTATNLIPGMGPGDYTPGKSNIFLLDRDPDGDGRLVGMTVIDGENNLGMIDFDPDRTDYFRLISHSYGNPGRAANDSSSFASISADGKRIAFQSKASDLIAPGEDTNNAQDIFLFDLNTGNITRVSISSAGEQNSRSSYRPAISGDGELISFDTPGRLAADDNNDEYSSNGNDIYIRKPSISLTWRVSLTADGRQGVDYKFQQESALSWTGQYVLWSSSSTLDQDGSFHQDVQVFFRDQANPPNNPDVSPTSMMLGYVPYNESRIKKFKVTVQAAIKIREIYLSGDSRFQITSTTCPTGDVEIAPLSESEPYECEIIVGYYSDGSGGKQTARLIIAVDDRPYEANPQEYNRELQMYLEANGATVLYLPLMTQPKNQP